jgi:hypothetical protein
MMTRSSLNRIAEDRPLHKTVKQKYDSNNPDADRSNKKMTIEDDIHQPAYQAQFQTTLRQTASAMNSASATAAPPSFADADGDKWVNKKFKIAQKMRREHKDRILKNGTFSILGTSNQNTATKPLKRRYSRGSAPAFTNVDFDVTGNTADVQHLISHAKGANNHAPSDLNFETNLRTYRAEPDTVPQMPSAFKYPIPDNKVDSVGIYKGQLKPLKGRELHQEYREQFADKNYNNIKCLKNPTTKNQKTLLQWEVSLRDNGGQQWSWDRNQKPLKSKVAAK